MDEKVKIQSNNNRLAGYIDKVSKMNCVQFWTALGHRKATNAVAEKIKILGDLYLEILNSYFKTQI